MNNIIYKYHLDIKESQVVKLPLNAELLSINVQNEFPEIWALIDPEEKEFEERFFMIVPTGVKIDDNNFPIKFINTIFINNATLVFHVFERI